jgi:hypothetical protein
MNAGREENKEREIGHIIESKYEKYFGEEAINKMRSAHDPQSSSHEPSKEEIPSAPYFIRAVCEIVQYIYIDLLLALYVDLLALFFDVLEK